MQRISMREQGWLLVGLCWIVFTVIGYILFAGSGSHRIWVAVLFLPALVLTFLLFSSLWVFFFEMIPGYLLRVWQGPPWRTPRKLHAFGPEWETRYQERLLERLDVTSEDLVSRTTYYVDRYTKQKWVSHCVERGFGFGIELVPVKDE